MIAPNVVLRQPKSISASDLIPLPDVSGLPQDAQKLIEE